MAERFDPRSTRRRLLRNAGWVVVATGLLAAGLAACGGSDPIKPPTSVGVVLPAGHPVPATPLVDQNGQPVTLQSFRGRYVVLAQFLTLCQDECPITTGAFQDLQASVRQAGLANQVAFIEATVDPDRDTVARLKAYQTRFGADWTLLTGTDANVAALWKHFGIYYQKIPEQKPPSTDWLTGKPLTYDVDHTNGFILIDPSGNERFITSSLPFLHGQLPSNLKSLLDQEGIEHLNDGIPGNSYTIPQALAALSWLVGHRLPQPHG